MYLTAETLDDLLAQVYQRLLSRKEKVQTTRGDTKELNGILLKLRNPRARLSRSEMRGKLFSSIGELLWYLAKTNDLEFIKYYVRKYEDESEDGKTIRGAYGPRLFNWRSTNQVKNVLTLLRDYPTSRRAVIQLFDGTDLKPRPKGKKAKEIPCTCTLQFTIRQKRLHMFTSMRSNDAFIGLPHDIFAFTMFQEIIARSLGVELGSYKHAVGSLHLYKPDFESTRKYLLEGVQRTVVMPQMPPGNPWTEIGKVLAAEAVIRTGGQVDAATLELPRYWQDIVRLLQIYALKREERNKGIPTLKRGMSTRVYDVYIENRRRAASKHEGDSVPVQRPLFDPEAS